MDSPGITMEGLVELWKLLPGQADRGTASGGGVEGWSVRQQAGEHRQMCSQVLVGGYESGHHQFPHSIMLTRCFLKLFFKIK